VSADRVVRAAKSKLSPALSGEPIPIDLESC
jgi:hypothetical protein